MNMQISKIRHSFLYFLVICGLMAFILFLIFKSGGILHSKVLWFFFAIILASKPQHKSYIST